MPTTVSKNSETRLETDDKKGVITHQQMFYSAPLPPASEFEKYEKVLKGSADRIIKLAENQSSHRRFIEKVVVIFDVIKSFAGLLSALIIVLTGIGAGVYLIMHDKSTQGLVTLFIPLATIIGTFIFKESQKSKIVEKDK
ncbi:MAG: DUF2335 domain-containing protein [Candidatus Paceibacterota bacterium]|jgi:uncharacterized membrane protein